ncbi:MAG TPA: MarR family transcriptional regulator [Candidatus Sulfotelmatobacter sp.]|nr:MarR family transcriptional regulator [Candidatus Sulfotelmatobacter sp.]
MSKADWRRANLLASVLLTGGRVQAALDKLFLPHGLTMLDASVLLLCVEAPLSLTPGKLAVVLGRDKGKITRVVDRLEINGFVTRDIGRRDRRISLLKPTNQAKKITPVLTAVFAGIHRELFAGMIDSEFQQLTKSLAQLLRNAAGIARSPICLARNHHRL